MANQKPTSHVKVLVLRTAGTNCDEETAYAFRLAGATVVELLHIGLFLRRERRLDEFDVLALPGGFSYGDDLGAGTVLANQLRTRLSSDLYSFVDSGRLVLGICNGFQVLVRLGILPGWGDEKCAALNENVSAKFEDRWVRLRVENDRLPFLRFALAPDTAPEGRSRRFLRLPVAHREGRFVLKDPAAAVARLREQGQIALTYRRLEDGEIAAGRYPDNPNGSLEDVAGISNESGNVLGLMPHPERFVSLLQDPLWTRTRSAAGRAAGGGPASPGDVTGYEELAKAGDGFGFFSAALNFAAEHKKSWNHAGSGSLKADKKVPGIRGVKS